jgi:hypothetical protein
MPHFMRELAGGHEIASALCLAAPVSKPIADR